MRFVFVVALVVASSLACSGRTAPNAVATPTGTATSAEASATAENLAIVAGYMLESEQFDPEIAAWLKAQLWPVDGTQASIDLITTILHVGDIPRTAGDVEALHRRRIEDALVFLASLAEQGWYRDGFEHGEKQRVNLLLSAASDEDAGNLEGDQIHSNPDSRWVLSARRTLEAQLFDSVVTADGRQLIIAGIFDRVLEAEVRKAMALAAKYYAAVEEYAGPIEGEGFVIAVDPDLRYCGLASWWPLITVHPVCVQDATVVHEMVHLAAPPTFYPWFNEGIAYFGAGRIAEVQEPEEDPCKDLETGVCAPDLRLSDGEEQYSAEARRGSLFISDLAAVVGVEALSEVIKTTNPNLPDSEQALIERIRAATPPDKATEVGNLIRRLALDLRLPVY